MSGLPGSLRLFTLYLNPFEKSLFLRATSYFVFRPFTAAIIRLRVALSTMSNYYDSFRPDCWWFPGFYSSRKLSCQGYGPLCGLEFYAVERQ